MVAFIHGRRPWTVPECIRQMARVAEKARHARRHTPCGAYAPTAGICRPQKSGGPYSALSAVHRATVQNSNPHPVGRKTATARTPSRSRRCLLATRASKGITTTRAPMRSFGVLLNTMTTTRTTYTCIAGATLHPWPKTTRATGLAFVVSRTR